MIGLVLAATLMFDFSGTCVTGCTGTATLHVEVADTYVRGTEVDWTSPAPVLLDAVYTDNRQQLEYGDADGHSDFILLLPAVDGPGMALVLVNDQALRTFADGTWRWTGDGTVCDPGLPRCTHVASGVGATWVDPPAAARAVPWPAWLVLAGWGALVFWTTRR